MDSSLLPFVEVQLDWAARHRWQAGEAIARGPVRAQTLWLVVRGTLEVRFSAPRLQSRAATSPVFSQAPWHVSPGMVLLLPPHLDRSVATPDGAEWLSVGLRPVAFGRVALLDEGTSPVLWRPNPDEHGLLEAWMSHIIAEQVEGPPPPGNRPIVVKGKKASRLLPHLEAQDAVGALISSGLAQALFGVCIRVLRRHGQLAAAGGPLMANAPAWLVQTLRRIGERPHTSVHELAREAGFSPAQFRRNFHTWTGMAPHTYLTQQRLQKARLLLTTTNETVSVVAQEVGFDSTSYFTRLFTDRFGMPPARFRVSSRQTPS